MPYNNQSTRKRLTVVVPRPWETGTYAVVTAELMGEDEMVAIPGRVTCFEAESHAAGAPAYEGDVLKNLVSKSVTHWARTTESGRAAWKQSSKDFNVGDLSSEIGDGDLNASLLLHGISSLEIETHSNRSRLSWEFDNVLVDEQTLAAPAEN